MSFLFVRIQHLSGNLQNIRVLRDPHLVLLFNKSILHKDAGNGQVFAYLWLFFTYLSGIMRVETFSVDVSQSRGISLSEKRG